MSVTDPIAPDEIFVIGLGDHARVVGDVARSAGVRVVGFVDPRPGGSGSTGANLSMVGGLADVELWIGRHPNASFTVAVGNNRVRASIFEACTALGLRPRALIHPTAILLGGATVEPGAQILAGAVIGVDATVRSNAIVNTSATIDHDSRVEVHATVAPGVHLAGRVTIDVGAHIGIGASVREGIRVGGWAVVGAGAVVIEDVPPATTVVGVPARPLDR